MIPLLIYNGDAVQQVANLAEEVLIFLCRKIVYFP